MYHPGTKMKDLPRPEQSAGDTALQGSLLYQRIDSSEVSREVGLIGREVSWYRVKHIGREGSESFNGYLWSDRKIG